MKDIRIGIDFDNTIICYDDVFCNLAKSWQLVDADYQGAKKELKDKIQALPEGDLVWQRLQGKTYGEFIHQAQLFAGCKEFISHCNAQKVALFIVSHKTEFGHFDEKQISCALRHANGCVEQGLSCVILPIPEENVFFETTREEKIARIKALNCTHFIDDLVEVLCSPLFPREVQRFLFQPIVEEIQDQTIKPYSNWTDIKNAIFTNA